MKITSFYDLNPEEKRDFKQRIHATHRKNLITGIEQYWLKVRKKFLKGVPYKGYFLEECK